MERFRGRPLLSPKHPVLSYHSRPMKAGTRSDARLAPRMLVLVPVFVYLLLACASLRLPGLYDDEAIVGFYSLKIREALLAGRPLEIPTGIHYYHGSADSWAALPAISLGLDPTAALRLTFVLLGACSVAGLYRLVHGMTGRRAPAFLAALLLAASPTFVLGTRLGAYFGSTLVLYGLAAAGCFFAWTRSRRRGWFVLLGALLGVGMNARAQFLFVGAAFLPLILADFAGRSRHRREDLRTAALAAAAGVIAAAPLLMHLAVHWRGVWGFVHARTEATGVPLLSMLDAASQFERFRGLLDGRGLMEMIAPQRTFDMAGRGRGISGYEFFGNTLFPWIYAASFAGLGAFAVADWRNERRGRAFESAAILLWQAGYFAACALLSFASLPFHALGWLPFPQLTAACFAARAAESMTRERLRIFWPLAGLVVFANGLIDARALVEFDRYARHTGGRDRYSEAVVPLRDWLLAAGIRRPVTLTWGLDFDLGYLSRLKIIPIRAHMGERPEIGAGSVFLVEHANRKPGEDAAADDLMARLGSEGYACRESRIFRDRLGLPAFRVRECVRRNS